MHIEFYKLSSQIIPILFIALALQSAFVPQRLRYEKNEKKAAIVHADSFLVAVFFLALAEARSLEIVYYGKSYTDDAYLISIAMIIPAFVLTAEYVFALINRPKEAWRKTSVIIWIAMAVIFVATLFSHPN